MAISLPSRATRLPGTAMPSAVWGRVMQLPATPDPPRFGRRAGLAERRPVQALRLSSPVSPLRLEPARPPTGPGTKRPARLVGTFGEAKRTHYPWPSAQLTGRLLGRSKYTY